MKKINKGINNRLENFKKGIREKPKEKFKPLRIKWN